MITEKIAFLFPGQGSQTLGMGQKLAQSFPLAWETFQEADDILHFPLSELCWKGPEEDLNDTFNTQPALLVHSIAVLRVVQSQFPDIRMSFAAGHSLGEYPALIAAGALSFQDGLSCVRERGRVMREVGEKTPGGMMAILGLELDLVEEISNQISSETPHSIWVANDNCPGQVVLSGTVAGLAVAEERLSAAGVRKIVRLTVSIPSHCPLMLKAQEEFNQTLERIPFLNPVTPIVGNVSATFLHSMEEIKKDLCSQLISRVCWRESMQKLISSGITRIFELGPGNVLSGLMHRIDRSISVLSLDSPTSLSSLSQFTSANN